jgi:hypothetical protein
VFGSAYAALHNAKCRNASLVCMELIAFGRAAVLFHFLSLAVVIQQRSVIMDAMIDTGHVLKYITHHRALGALFLPPRCSLYHVMNVSKSITHPRKEQTLQVCTCASPFIEEFHTHHPEFWQSAIRTDALHLECSCIASCWVLG